jgi:formylglycine-generating enzyme required for sulfatase activity/tRNA A-37 threonylcarbamoyl transferase component Bud32
MEDPLGLVGKRIDDKYQIERLVGEGGFAVVYRAQHLIFKRPVAIKAFRAMSDFAVEQRERLLNEFIQEGALLADLSERSAAIIQARDVGTLTTPAGDWVPYMVLEWLDGAALDAVMSDERVKGMLPRTIEQVVKLLEPIAIALALAHKRGIAHRDVKPANIFLLGDPRGDDCAVKLLDFGIAKVVQDAQKMAGSFSKTQGTVTSFTPAYGAPEQFSRTHGATGPWTDVFSLALVIGELLTHTSPLQGDDFVQLGFASANASVRPTPRTLGAAIPDEVEAVFAKALAVPPDARYPGAGEFWSALRDSLHMTPLRAASPSIASAISSASTMVAVPSSGTPITGPIGPVSQPSPVGVMAPPSNMSSSQTPVIVPPPSKGNKTAIFLGVGILALAAGVAIAFSIVGKGSTTTTTPSASVASASVSVVVPPPPACPTGMIHIDGGEFFMGSSDPRALDNEKPPHSVTLSPYCIDTTEVTVAAYKACSDSGKCLIAGKDNFFGGFDDLGAGVRTTLNGLCNINEPSAKGSHPINCIDWEQASNFCSRKAPGGRLPTEAEWEYAARGPDGRAYPWGDEAPSARFLNACGTECTSWGKKNKVQDVVTFAAMYKEDDKFPTTAPVGSFPDGKSRYGLEDVVGNVWEWTGDYFADYAKDAQKDPTGPKAGEDGRVARGGAWNGADPSWVRPTFRFHFAPSSRSYGIGFRCAAALSTTAVK